MPVDLSDILVVGVSSRALFDLEDENAIFDTEGIEGYRKYQLAHENEPLKIGSAFYLVKSLLDITRVALSGGEPLAPYIDAYDVDLFLSKDEKDVQTVIDSKACAAASIYAPPQSFNPKDNRVKIAFDADAVLFSDESEHRYKTEGIDAFLKHEKDNEDNPLNKGPFAELLIKLSRIQDHLPTTIELSPLRLSIVTARSAPSHMRVIKTLRKWGVYVDEVYFMGGLSKDKVLEAFGAHIFFDDQEAHLDATSKVVPSGRVPYDSDSPMKAIENAKKLK
jgi:5'-nucleotidase